LILLKRLKQKIKPFCVYGTFSEKKLYIFELVEVFETGFCGAKVYVVKTQVKVELIQVLKFGDA
jgi:hypothetical protein